MLKAVGYSSPKDTKHDSRMRYGVLMLVLHFGHNREASKGEFYI